MQVCDLVSAHACLYAMTSMYVILSELTGTDI